MALRRGEPFERSEEDKEPLVLSGSPNQITSRELRPRSVRREHIAPGVLAPLHLAEDFVDTDATAQGTYFQIGTLLVCVHKITNVTAGSATWAFPRTFDAAPAVVATVNTANPRMVTVTGITTSQAEVHVHTDAGGSAEDDIQIIAIGQRS